MNIQMDGILHLAAMNDNLQILPPEQQFRGEEKEVRSIQTLYVFMGNRSSGTHAALCSCSRFSSFHESSQHTVEQPKFCPYCICCPLLHSDLVALKCPKRTANIPNLFYEQNHHSELKYIICLYSYIYFIFHSTKIKRKNYLSS